MSSIPLSPVVLFRGITTALENHGFSSERIVEQAGLPQSQFLPDSEFTPASHVYRLAEQAARAVGDERFGLVIADENPVDSVGKIGKAISRSLCVFDAVKTMNRLYGRFSSSARFWIVEGDEEIWWCRRSLAGAETGRKQMGLYSLGHLINIVRLGAGPGWLPAKVRLEDKSPSGLERLEAFANTDVRVEQGITGLAIPRSLLPRRLLARGSSSVASEGDELSWEPPSTELLGSVQQLLQSLVRFGHPEIEVVAEAAGVNVRTLQRRLREEGVTFKKLVDQARFQAAMDLMKQTDARLIDVAHDLGYSDQANFNRAFRRWAGVSPGEYRLQLNLP